METNAPKYPFIVGTAGHIDHGKSSLVKALTGTDPDRLIEEKKRGITIELGFARLELPNDTLLGIVDVPGHERFIRQMIAGASGIDMALVCIAADDGIMPQTREHLAVLQLLGVTHCVIALTKCDAVDNDWIELVEDEIKSELSDTPFSDASIVAVSAYTHQGLDQLKNALYACAQSLERKDKGTTVRMPIDRVFTIKGSGTVVTGTLWNGTIRPGDELELLPRDKIVRIRTIQVHSTEVPESNAGMRTALNLANVSTDQARPGDFLVTPHTQQLSDRFDARFTYIPVLSEKKPLVSGTRIRLAHGTHEVLARILCMNGQAQVSPNETAYVQIRLDEPLPVAHNDHIIARFLSPARVIGGGVVLNAHPRRRTTLTPEDQTLLDALTRNDEQELCCAVLEASTTPITLQEMQRITGLPKERIASILNHVTTSKGKPLYSCLTHGSQHYYAKKTLLQKHLMMLEQTLLTFHAEHPSAIGIAKKALQQRFPIYLEEGCFEALLEKALLDQKLISVDGSISHPQAGAGARNLEKQSAQTLLHLLLSYQATPPALSELFEEAGLDPSQGSKAIALLERQGQAHRVNKTLCFSQEALSSLWEKAKRYLETQESATAAQLKEAMGTSRKYAIPLLEYFDNKGYTIRKGDSRILGSSSQ